MHVGISHLGLLGYNYAARFVVINVSDEYIIPIFTSYLKMKNIFFSEPLELTYKSHSVKTPEG